jgi:hypothetical protein
MNSHLKTILDQELHVIRRKDGHLVRVKGLQPDTTLSYIGHLEMQDRLTCQVWALLNSLLSLSKDAQHCDKLHGHLIMVSTFEFPQVFFFS